MVRVWRNLVISTSHSRPLKCIYLVLKDLQERIFHRFLQEPILIFQQIFLILNPNTSCQDLGPSFSSAPCIDGGWLALLIKYNIYSHPDTVIQLVVEMAVTGSKAGTQSSLQPVQDVTWSISRIQALSPWTLPGREYPPRVWFVVTINPRVKPRI